MATFGQEGEVSPERLVDPIHKAIVKSNVFWNDLLAEIAISSPNKDLWHSEQIDYRLVG